MGDGLWAVARSAADGSVRALCVHNASDQPLSFTAGDSLPAPEGTDAPLVFVRGAARTREAADGDIAFDLDGHGFVWLARIGGRRT